MGALIPKKKFVWGAWMLNAIFAAIFIVCVIVARRKGNEQNRYQSTFGQALIFVYLCPAVLVALSTLISFFILTKRSIAGTGAGVGYGFVVGASFFLSLHFLSVTVLMGAFCKQDGANCLSSETAANVFAAFCFVANLVFSILLIFWRKDKEVGGELAGDGPPSATAPGSEAPVSI